MRAKIPRFLDVPTGLGKTSVMAIWLVARSLGAKLPRRLVYVVDRRAVVDQATAEAERLGEWAKGVKASLGLAGPLPISTLRGQHVDNRKWLEDPATPAIIVGTVDMVGSRLLFEGYGVSQKMRPYHAGLLGVDALVVLDEAHLVPPFEHLLRAVASDPAFRPCDERSRFVPPFHLLALSATGRTRDGGVVQLTKKDLKHKVVKRRLCAKKYLRIKELDRKTELEKALAEQAWNLADKGKKPVRVLVYSDSREVARKAKESVEKLAKGDKTQRKSEVKIETELLVGARRVFEREELYKRLKNLGFIAGNGVQRKFPAFLFATSAGEVGVDLDADHMVCDLVAWERMVQRLGRVNRRGEPQGHVANIVVLVERDREPEKVPEPKNLLKLIKRLPRINDGIFDVSPRALRNLKESAADDKELQKLLDDATTPEPLRPAMTRALIEAWALTSLEKHTGRPAIQPWLRGWIKDDPPQTAILWRTHLPVRAEGPPPSKKEIEAFFEAAPPHLSEILETETFRVEKWIAARAKHVCNQRQEEENRQESLLRDEDVVAFALEPDGRLRKSFRLKDFNPSNDKDKEASNNLLAGATLVVDRRLGGLKDGLLDEGEDGLPRTADDGQNWLDGGVVGFRVRSIEASANLAPEGGWRERFRFGASTTDDGEPTRWLVVEKWRHDAATEEDRSAANPQLLDEHQSRTEKCARRLAQALGLDRKLAKVLALAARLHDEGKRAARWQRAFHAPKGGVYAKTEGPIDYRLLDGYRHELGSLLGVENDERVRKLPKEQRDLVLHLIAAHHGFARPVMGTSGCDDAPPSVLGEKAREISLRFALLQDRWGPWGLAWWEALLRAADQQASRENDERAAAQGGP